MPKVSVIIPVYNVEKYLRECLDSVINQTLQDIEIILIDDGGKDNCPRIIDEYAKKDSRIVAIHKENGGYGQTCNVGLERAHGEYISIVEPDDYIDKNMYEDLYKLAKKNDTDIVKSDFYKNIQCENKKQCNKHFSQNLKTSLKEGTYTLNEQPEFLQYHPSIWSALYKKEFLDENNIRFVEAPGAGWTDNPFQVQCFCLAEKIMYTSNAYYYWRVTSEDPMGNIEIPLLRSMEIHNWLKSKNIDDKQILKNLYIREMKYLKIIHRIIKFSDFLRYKKLLNKYFDTLHWNIINNDELLSNRQSKFFNKLKKHFYVKLLSDKYKLFKQNLKRKQNAKG